MLNALHRTKTVNALEVQLQQDWDFKHGNVGASTIEWMKTLKEYQEIVEKTVKTTSMFTKFGDLFVFGFMFTAIPTALIWWVHHIWELQNENNRNSGLLSWFDF